MKVSLTLTIYAALFLSVYVTDLSKNRSETQEKVYLSNTVVYLKKGTQHGSTQSRQMTEIVFFKALH